MDAVRRMVSLRWLLALLTALSLSAGACVVDGDEEDADVEQVEDVDEPVEEDAEEEEVETEVEVEEDEEATP